jgi:hypothetical protein
MPLVQQVGIEASERPAGLRERAPCPGASIRAHGAAEPALRAIPDDCLPLAPAILVVAAPPHLALRASPDRERVEVAIQRRMPLLEQVGSPDRDRAPTPTCRASLPSAGALMR